MRKILTALIGWAVLVFATHVYADQSEDAYQKELDKLSWVRGPASGSLADKATIRIPAGFVYLDEADTTTYLQLAGNPPSPGHYLVAPDDLRWFAVFSFDDSGYVKDDEKIDASALLKQLQEGDESSNKERKSLGMSELYTEGWQVEPHYDNETKRLEWGLRLRADDGEKVINYTSRLLSRTGVMSAVLVSSPEDLAKDTPEFKGSLDGFEFNAGERYSEFRQGDKVAAYGLGALILGGAAAVATKKGLWASLAGVLVAGWKFVLAAGAAALAGMGKFFKKKDD